MAKKSSLFKTLTTILVMTTLTLSVATGIVIGHAFNRANHNSQLNQGEKVVRSVESIEKTNTYGLIDEYTITYTDGTTSTFIVANGQDGPQGIQGFPGVDGHTPTIVIGENGNWIVDDVDTGVSAKGQNGADGRSILSIEKTETNGLIDTYTITYSDNTTSSFIVVNGQDGPQGIQGIPGENGVTPTISINEEGYWVINGEVTTFKAVGKDGTSFTTGYGAPNDNSGNVGDTYYDIVTGNIYVKGDNGWGQPIGNNQGASVTVGNGEPNDNEGRVGDSYIDANTGNIYVKTEDGWSQPIGNNQGASFITGTGAPDANQGKAGDSYLDTSTGLIYTRDENGWGTAIGSIMGPQGPQGQPGTGLLTGTGEPNQNFGNDGDSYIDTATWNYYAKENGVWVLKGNIKGSNGTNGSTPYIGADGHWWIGNTDTGIQAAGASISTGHGNPNGDNSDPNNPIAPKEGNIGDTYIDLDTGAIYVKDENGWHVDPNGAAGIHGATPHIGEDGKWWIGDQPTGISATGPQGPTGQTGTSIYVDSGAPSQGLGNDKDSYIDTSTWNFYVKENGEWVLKGNIKGDQGQAGAGIHVVSCVKTGSNGLVDTYTITFDNGDTATFEVVNGSFGSGGSGGSSGSQGASGSSGNIPVIEIGANGHWYIDGVDTGVPAQGPQGQTGADGNGISNIIILSSTATETTYRIIFTNGTPFDFTVANGVKGENGADGTCMRTGETDPASDLGKNGDSYINTITWDYFVKEDGIWVFKGNIKGGTGATGATGAQGATGATGQNGVSVVSITRTDGNGAPGTTDTYTITYSNGTTSSFTVTNGANGQNGRDGNMVFVGIGAPTSATGGANGDSYIDTSTWDYYVKENGVWVLQGNFRGADGATGATGAAGQNGQNGQDGRGIASITKTGPGADGLTYTYTITYTDGSEPYVFSVTNGKNGTSVLTGTVNPTDQGVDGDSYINTTTWDYFVKENGSWVKKGNIKGVSVVSITRTDGNGAPGTTDTYTITYSNGTTSTFTVTNGANGQDGQDGKTLRTGTGAPNGALGSVGDSYIDVSSWTLYVKTAEDTWTSKGSFNGADGQDGTSVTITNISTSGTGAAGTSDTYTVTFSDGNTLVITVYNGANGVDGADGTNGNSLLNGTTDPTTQGVDGDSYINTTTWEYFIKESGTWISKGIIKGNDGTSVTSGTGVPDNNDGADGDSYIDITTWKFYVKESGIWVEHGNIHNELDKYDVSFNLSYDSDSDGIYDTYTTVVDVEHGHNINNNKPADPTRDGWIFQGWYTSEGTKWDFEKDVVTGDIVLYARWAKFKVENGVLTECTATGDVVIPEFFDGQFITAIGDNVFKNDTAITSITLPATITSIGNSAFEGCTGLTSIIIPFKVTTIGDSAFKGCTNLTYVYINENNSRTNGGLKTIGESAFEGCSSLKNLVIPKTVTLIGNDAFKGCDSLESIALPYIPNDTNAGSVPTPSFSTGHGEPDSSYDATTVYMDEDTNIIYIRVNPADSWTVIFNAFSAAELTYGSGAPGAHGSEDGYVNVDNGDVYVWAGSSWMKYFNILTYDYIGVPAAFASIPTPPANTIGNLFGTDNSGLPASLKTIILNGDAAIPENALNGCSNLENIIVSGNPASIGAGAFKGCTSLKSITLPYIGGTSYDPTCALTYSYGHGEPAADYDESNVYLDLDTTNVWQYIGGTWVEKIVWSSITSDTVYVDAGEPTITPSSNNDIYIDYLTGKIYGYNGTSWSEWTRVEELDQMSLLEPPTGVNTMFFGYIFGASDFSGQASYVPASLKTIILTGANGKNGDEIPQGAFAFLSSVETIILPDNVKKIQRYAFAQLILDSLVVPDSVTYMAEEAFYHATIKDLTIPFVGMNRMETQNGLGWLFSTYQKYIEKITLTGGNGVDGTTLSRGAFDSCKALTSVTLPNNITRIEDYAFYYCENLTSIILPDSVTYIGQFAFNFCTDLSYVKMPANLIEIDTYAFGNCDSLTYVVLPEGLQKIGWYAFTWSGLKNVVIPASVTRIGCGSFSYCKELLSVLVLDGADKIVENGAFQKCTNLKYVKFECAISSFGYAGGDWAVSYFNPFYDCTNLEYVNLGRDLLAPSDEADASTTPFYTLRTNANNSERIGVFEGFTHLKTVVLPNTITEIAERSFMGCSSLESVNLPTGLTAIGDKAFAYCSSLKAISVPNTVTSIGKGAFEAAKKWVHYGNLKDSYSLNATSIVVNTFANRTTSGSDGDIFVCTDSDHFGHVYVRYGTGNNWQLKDTIHYSFASGTSNPAANTAESTNLNVVFINTSTGEMLINCASTLESISLPFIGRDNGNNNNYNYIGYIFGTNTYLENNTYVPYSLKTIIINNANYMVSNVFYKCYSVETIVINGTASSVGLNAFYQCYSLKNVSLPSTITTINMSAFALCTSLKNLSLPENVKTLGYQSIAHCYSLETVYLPYGLTSIGKECFYKDTSLKIVYLPDTVTSVDICAFQECTALKSVRFSNNMDTISQQMFLGCTSLESIMVPANIQRIDLNAFNGCTSLKYAFFEEGIKVIHEYAFQDCSSLTAIVIPNSIKDLGRGVFYGCSSLESITLPFAGGSYMEMGDLLADDSIEIDGAPNDAMGNDNDLLVDTTNDKVWRKIDGKWYSQLQFVHVGYSTPGDITYGHGAPNPSSGDSFYADLDTLDFYEVDSVDPNVWHKIGNLRTLFGKFAYICVSPNGNRSFDTFNYDTLSNVKTVVLTKGVYDQVNDRYFIQEASFKGCIDIENITLPNNIYEIESNAFINCSSLINIAFGNNPIVEYFNDYVFSGCSSLESIVIPNSVEAFGVNTFENCTALRYVAFADGSVFIGMDEEAFAGCSSLISISLPNTTEFIGFKAFKDCTSLETVVIPSSVVDLSEAVFDGCTSLKVVSVPYLPFAPSNTTSYKDADPTYSDDNSDDNWIWVNVNTGDVWYRVGGGWYKSFNLKADPSDTIIASDYEPNNPNEGDIWVYKGTYNEELVYQKYISGNWTDPIRLNIRFLGALFEEYAIDNSSVPESLKTVIISNGDNANYTFSFKDCEYLETVVLPDDIEIIGAHAFNGCSSLKNVIIPDTVTFIGSYAFSNCSSLVAIELPSGLTTIEDNAFSGCENLVSLGWNYGFMDRIGDRAFSGCSKLVYIPSAEIICDYAFEYCESIKYLYFEGTQEIGEEAFAYCSSLVAIEVYDTIDSIGGNAFAHCYSLTSIVFETTGSIKVIGGGAFTDCRSLTSITIPNGLLELGMGAFQDCSNLRSIVIPNTTTTIKAGAFTGCNSLESLTVPFIGEYPTVNDVNKDKIYIMFGGFDSSYVPSSLKTVNVTGDKYGAIFYGFDAPESTLGRQGDAYYDYNNQEWYVKTNSDWEDAGSGFDYDFHIENGEWYNGYSATGFSAIRGDSIVATIYIGAFSGCSNIEHICLGEGITTIEQAAFRNCSHLKTIELPASLTTVDQNAFAGCNWLTTVYYGGSSTDWSSISIHATGNAALTSADRKYAA